MSEMSIHRVAGHLWRWPWGVGVALLALAVLTTSLGIKAVAAPAPEVEKKPEPKKDEPKKDETKPEPKKEPGVEQPGIPALPALPPGVDQEMARRMQEAARRSMEHMQRMRAGMLPLSPFGFNEETRLGVRLEKPSAALAEQLDLPKG